jgi:hypothetical protein
MATKNDGRERTPKYRVHLDSVFECQLDDCEYNAGFEKFDDAKAFAVDAFERVIDCLTHLREQVTAAKEFDDLDLGWWEPLIERVERASHSSETISAHHTTTEDEN